MHRRPRIAFTLICAVFGAFFLACKHDTPRAAGIDAGANAQQEPLCTKEQQGTSLRCKRFATAAEALAPVLATHPRVVAFGEAHARASATTPTTVERFQKELLPSVVGSDEVGATLHVVGSDEVGATLHVVRPQRALIIELVVPNPSCKKEDIAPAQKTGAAIAEGQHTENKNHYVALGTAAKKLGATPFPLLPSCEQLAAIGKAGEGDVAAMLTLVAKLAGEKAVSLLTAENAARDGGASVQDASKLGPLVMYGGALHNDRLPRPGTEDFSFGPLIDGATGEQYAEVDLVLPEQIEATEVWKRLPWYSMYDASTQGDAAWLYEIAPRRWVLFFPRG